MWALRPHEGAAASRERRAEGQLGGQGTGRYVHTGRWEIQSRVGRNVFGEAGRIQTEKTIPREPERPRKRGHLEDPEVVCQA